MLFPLNSSPRHARREPFLIIHSSRPWLAALVLAFIATAAAVTPAPPAGAQCQSSAGPDIYVFAFIGLKKWGTVGNITGYSLGSNACNIGDQPLLWEAQTNKHPAIAQNMYRLKNGRFEQIGMSWIKHGFYALANSELCTCDPPGTGALLGVGCSDVYDSVLNGNQGGGGGAGGLGPRSEINASTGAFPFPYTSQGQTGDAIYKRLQIHNSDLNPAQNAGAQYFAELHYVSPDDAEFGNDNNNCSYIPVSVGSFNNGGWNLDYSGSIRDGQPAILAWAEFDPGVHVATVDVPNDGRFIVASKASNNGNGTWRYEYAVFNMSSHRSARGFRVPVPASTNVTNTGFHDVSYHSGEPYSGANWAAQVIDGKLAWLTDTFDDNPNANALRWSTLYNFRFDADTPPGNASATINLFRPGTPASVLASVKAPGGAGGGGGGGGGNAPANNSCVNAQPIELGDTPFTTIDATTGGPSVSCASTFANDVWFKFTSPFTGRLTASTCGNADFDSVIAAYDGCACGSLTQIKCNNDAAGCNGASRVTFDVQVNQCYLIRVGGIGGQTGSGVLSLWCPDPENAAAADLIITGQAAGDRLGHSCAPAGDVNGDFQGDLLVGAFRNDAAFSNAGIATVHTSPSLDGAAQFQGAAIGDRLGYSVAGDCDCNGDGLADQIVGAPFHDGPEGTDSGAVYAYSGAGGSLLWVRYGQNAGDRLGSAVSCAGDVNNDGLKDVIAGAPYFDAPNRTNAGRAFIFSGGDGATLRIRTGAKAYDLFGFAVTGLGDVDGDGHDDVAISAPYSDPGAANAGRVYLFSGANGALKQQVKGNAAGERLGYSIAGQTFTAGGLRTFLAVGAPGYESNRGRVRLYQRRHANPQCNAWLCLKYTKDGQAAGDRFGWSVAVADVTATPMREILIGAQTANANGAGSGAVYIYGAGGAQIEKLIGQAAGDRFGYCVRAAGDVNGDGKDDVLVGAPRNDVGGNDAGRAYVFLTGSAPLPAVAGGIGGILEQQTSGGQGRQSQFIADGDPSGGPWEDGPLPPADQLANDLLVILDNWSTRDGPGDLNEDGIVDANDLMTALASWPQP